MYTKTATYRFNHKKIYSKKHSISKQPFLYNRDRTKTNGFQIGDEPLLQRESDKNNYFIEPTLIQLTAHPVGSTITGTTTITNRNFPFLAS